jgi:hypothetical protein
VFHCTAEKGCGKAGGDANLHAVAFLPASIDLVDCNINTYIVLLAFSTT